jgi:16S rRNA (guanine527-N7)-methyltransferase
MSRARPTAHHRCEQRRRRERVSGPVGPSEEGRSTSREPLPTHVRGLPPLGPAYDAVVERGLAELGLRLTDDVRRAVDDHLRLMLAWSGSVNLTSIREPSTAGSRHVLDSLAAVKTIRDLGADSLVDLGSGGGYPGLALAAALPARALLVEATAKKALFLETAVRAVGLDGRVDVRSGRSEDLARDPVERERWPLATARAVADLATLVELAFPLLVVGGSLVAWKRGDIASELGSAERAVLALGGGRIDVRPVGISDLAGHVLVVVRKAGPTGVAYPRDPAVRRRRPW